MADPHANRSHFPIRPDWLALHEEPTLEPALPIIDAHHHVWDHAGSRYLFFELLDDVSSGHNVRATIYMECGAMYREDGAPEARSLGETEFVAGIAAMSASGHYGSCRIAAGMIGNVDLRLGGRVRPLLKAHVAASGGRLRGIRNISAYHPDPAARGSLANPPPMLLADPVFRAGFGQLAPLGLSFDAHLYHTQHAELEDLARAFPDTTIVINHIGSPISMGPYADKRAEVFRDWSLSLTSLARCPNVAIKLGGFGMRMFNFGFEAWERPASSEQLAEVWGPYAQACIDIFGPQRCMFESNFPVDKAVCSYRTLWNVYKRIIADFQPSDRLDMLGGTAERLYRL